MSGSTGSGSTPECRRFSTDSDFPRDRFDRRLRNFSGGERNRAGLARLLAGQGNLLLLDEPTNHLDIESTTWLEQFLKESEKAVMIVSHDRTFLKAVTDQVWELNFAKIEKYAGGIERYLVERYARREQAAHWYRHQQEEIKRLEEFVRRNMAGQKTKQAQSKLKYLGRIKRLPPPPPDDSGPTITVQSSGRSYAHVLSVEEVSVAYGSEPIVEDIEFDIYRGDKVGLIGRNGSGKSTLLKALIGELTPASGNIRLGNNVDVAYFDQDLSDLNENATVLDNLWTLDPTAEVGPIRSFLARFGFSGEDVLKRVAALSGGEKTKLCLARLLVSSGQPDHHRRADQPPRHAGARGARGGAAGVRRELSDRQPRPVLPRPGGRSDRASERRPLPHLHRQLLGLRGENGRRRSGAENQERFGQAGIPRISGRNPNSVRAIAKRSKRSAPGSKPPRRTWQRPRPT